MVQIRCLGLFAVAVLTACSTTSEPSTRAARTPEPSPTQTVQQKGFCPSFPDGLIDDFREAYNERDLDALEAMVTAKPIRDVVPAAYAGTASFDGVTEWAEAGWEADDRMNLTGYTAFYPTKRGFQMQMARHSEVLRAHGIEAVTTTLDAISRGCTIESLNMSDVVQAKREPCAFYDEFADIADVAANEPEACRDGSGRYARDIPAAVWTGDRVLIWGGRRSYLFTYEDVALDGFVFDPTTDRWTSIPDPPTPAFIPEASVWTGSELVVVGGRTRGSGVVAAAYDPARRAWRTIASPPRPWSGFEGVWTGTELILWGGPDHSAHPARRGLVYTPATETWSKTSPAPIGGRWSHAVAWTGTEMIVWGGGDSNTDLADGAAYRPATDSWRKIAPAPLTPRQWLPLVWTGEEIIVWGGSSFSTSQRDGAAYDPETDTWRMLPPAPIRRRDFHSAVWTGSEVIVFGGDDYHRRFADGAAYDPASNRWRKLPPAPIAPRSTHTAVWTGTEMFVFGGGNELSAMPLGDGALYDPVADRWRRVIPFTRE
jgi:hypothetical protein